MITFCKSADCPSSENLLGLASGKISAKKSRELCAHLADCEFCAAEIELYAHHPQADDEAAPTTVKAEIPLPLYELAKALLDDKPENFSLLNNLLCEKAN